MYVCLYTSGDATRTASASCYLGPAEKWALHMDSAWPLLAADPQPASQPGLRGRANRDQLRSLSASTCTDRPTLSRPTAKLSSAPQISNQKRIFVLHRGFPVNDSCWWRRPNKVQWTTDMRRRRSHPSYPSVWSKTGRTNGQAFLPIGATGASALVTSAQASMT